MSSRVTLLPCLVSVVVLAGSSGAQGRWIRSGTLLPEGGYVGTERHFGWDAQLVGDWALVAAPPLESGTEPGVAYLYEGTGAYWRLDRTLASPGGTAADDFARSISLTMGRAWIGAPGERSGAGGVHLFEHQGAEWIEVLHYAPAPRTSHDELGATVVIAGERAVVGAPGDDAVHVLERQGGGWVPTAVLRPPAASGGSQDFGRALALVGDRVAVGAPVEGAAYIYVFQGGAWSLESRLVPREPATAFGTSLALEGERLVVGAPDDQNQGQVFVFERGTTWDETALLVSPSISPVHSFGASVSLSNGVVSVGAPGEDQDFGSLHVYELGEAGWQSAGHFVPDPLDGEGRFAYHVTVQQQTMLANIGLNDTGVIAYVGALYVWTQEPVLRRARAASVHGSGGSAGTGAQGTSTGPSTENLELDAGASHSGGLVLLLASLSGTTPGTDWNGVHLPLNHDPLLDALLGGTRTLGPAGLVLDARGRARFDVRLPAWIVLQGVDLSGVVLDGGTEHPTAVSAPLRLAPVQ